MNKMGSQIKAARPLTKKQERIWGVAQLVVSLVAKLWFRYEVHGAENLPQSGPYIVSPNHRSNLDTPLLPVISSRPLRFMGKDSLWEAGRFAALFLDTMGGFPVSRDSADRAAMRIAEAVLEGGEPLVMFPEGTRQSGPIIEPENMHSGPSFVAGRQRVPVIPVGLAGSAQAMTTGSKLVYPRKIIFVVGKPLEAPRQNENGRVTRSAITEHTEELRFRIQEEFDRAQALLPR